MTYLEKESRRTSIRHNSKNYTEIEVKKFHSKNYTSFYYQKALKNLFNQISNNIVSSMLMEKTNSHRRKFVILKVKTVQMSLFVIFRARVNRLFSSFVSFFLRDE